MENKQLICDRFLEACQATRYLSDLVELEYDAKDEIVVAVFEGGFKKRIDVFCDSGFAMMKDILSHL